MKNKILMCAPDFFEVSYVINPWMEGNIQGSDNSLAKKQWQNLVAIIEQFADVVLVEPVKGLPDMVFTANAGFVRGDRVIVSTFEHPERQGETPVFTKWFEDNGFQTVQLPYSFEGAGDALIDHTNDVVFCGYGHRSAKQAAWDIEIEFHSHAAPLRLIDDKFYHLDTCFCPLTAGFTLYYPAAFDDVSIEAIKYFIDEDKLIEVSEEDALNFACNAVNLGDIIIMNKCSANLQHQLNVIGFTVYQTDLSEFMKAGGSAKCLTLKLVEL